MPISADCNSQGRKTVKLPAESLFLEGVNAYEEGAAFAAPLCLVGGGLPRFIRHPTLEGP